MRIILECGQRVLLGLQPLTTTAYPLRVDMSPLSSGADKSAHSIFKLSSSTEHVVSTSSVTSHQPTIIICGVDEAGRGPLAGPVYAAAVILDPRCPIAGLADSKKLSEKRRNHLSLQIRQLAASWAIAEASVEEIDTLNILQASLLAMRRAVEALSLHPTEVLVDGLYCPDTGLPSRAIVKGDNSVAEISAASILAKTARDTAMLVLHETYPQYGFDIHKGYPTAAHLAALRMHGICAVHRKSFRPVRALL